MHPLKRYRVLGFCLLILSNVTALVGAAAGPSVRRWTYIQNIPGGNACAARLSGGEVDTMLMLDQSQQLILVAGRADWRAFGSEEIGLRIDGFQLEHLHASAFNNLILLPINDEVVLKRLKVGNDLYWLLPSGKYYAAITGLDNALDWVRKCEHAKHLHASGAS
jgi:hypothetical protein